MRYKSSFLLKLNEYTRDGFMGWHEIIYITGLLLLSLFLSVGGYILERDKYWIRIWNQMGKPDVDSIDELKQLVREQESTKIASGKQAKAS